MPPPTYARLSNRHAVPSVVIGWKPLWWGGYGGQIIVAPARWAGCLETVGATMVWNCLDHLKPMDLKAIREFRASSWNGVYELWPFPMPGYSDWARARTVLHAVWRELHEQNGTVIIMCRNAKHRSTACLAYYLVAVEGYNVYDAIALIRRTVTTQRTDQWYPPVMQVRIKPAAAGAALSSRGGSCGVRAVAGAAAFEPWRELQRNTSLYICEHWFTVATAGKYGRHSKYV